MPKTLTDTRKDIDVHVCAQQRNINNLFAKICEAHPEIVYEAFGKYLRRRSFDDCKHVIDLYHDEAVRLRELFTLD